MSTEEEWKNMSWEDYVTMKNDGNGGRWRRWRYMNKLHDQHLPWLLPPCFSDTNSEELQAYNDWGAYIENEVSVEDYHEWNSVPDEESVMEEEDVVEASN